jgi:hypothetical protein
VPEISRQVFQHVPGHPGRGLRVAFPASWSRSFCDRFLGLWVRTQESRSPVWAVRRTGDRSCNLSIPLRTNDSRVRRGSPTGVQRSIPVPRAYAGREAPWGPGASQLPIPRATPYRADAAAFEIAATIASRTPIHPEQVVWGPVSSSSRATHGRRGYKGGGSADFEAPGWAWWLMSTGRLQSPRITSVRAFREECPVSDAGRNVLDADPPFSTRCCPGPDASSNVVGLG